MPSQMVGWRSTRNSFLNSAICAAIKCIWRVATPRQTLTAIHEPFSALALGRVVSSRGLPWRQSGNGLAFCCRSWNAEKERICSMASARADRCRTLAGAVLPLRYVKIAAASVLFAFGLLLLIRKSHPRWGGMQIGFRDLAIWSFLMASAHGAGFMLLPILLRMSAFHSAAGFGDSAHHLHALGFATPWTALIALLVHTLGYLLVTGLIAFVVSEKVG